ncbi:hypothetical protein [Clostridium botulinum]|uniref:hypothetical protein n=1 Tax=Clostridium botulinum TaxID=1491 RepID=UPI00020750C1|nr:hypothetical protein [Clostridium botulinum]AEB77019.1 hypothetical protein CbC4_2354 [Clostridium botulinum BKT015925]MCD3198249.1 hypothetical protein [Clostridium botulinum C/D]MCD3203785.1 hypothetical protein [Clostridium botulinum C/D]MCD3211966.1 hypothetical protein [Clostridium botulinum C/D]MCD3213594.1 hypothetical protein [Clostridium botulinum C/D]
MADRETRILLKQEELNEFLESMKYQYGDNYMEYEEVKARVEFMKNVIKLLKEERI